MKSVAMVLFPDFLLLDMAGPLEVFSIANRYLKPEDRYQLTTLGAVPGAIRASNGINVLPDALIDPQQGQWDLLLVPGGPGAYNEICPPLSLWLKDVASRARCYGSICTGAFILGHAGLLDGFRSTTHWHYTERLIKAFPATQVETDQIFVRDRQLITSGGVTAGIDLALAVVAEDHGKKVAQDVAKVLLVVMKRQGGQARFSPLAGEVPKEETPITRVQRHVLEHLDEPFGIERMAALAAMSPRHFSRVFMREVNMTPMAFLQNARIDRARELLESEDLPLKTVAWRSGFGSVRYMRQVFSERLGVTPSEYREQFG